MIRTVWVFIHVVAATIPLSAAVVIGSYIGLPKRYYDKIPRWWARWILWATGARVEVHGIENLSADRAQIIVANHVSWYDVLALAAHTPKRYRFVAKKELARVPLWGHAWVAAGHISVDRTDNQRAVASLDQAGRTILEDNSSVIIFPEGTRSPTGELQSFKKGAFTLAMEAEVPILPVIVRGSGAMMAERGTVPTVLQRPRARAVRASVRRSQRASSGSSRAGGWGSSTLGGRASANVASSVAVGSTTRMSRRRENSSVNTTLISARARFAPRQ